MADLYAGAPDFYNDRASSAAATRSPEPCPCTAANGGSRSRLAARDVSGASASCWISDGTPDILGEMLRTDAPGAGAGFALSRCALHLKHRLVLVEWMADVCEEFALTDMTANLAILYADRILSSIKVPKTSLQLVALCCILIAGARGGGDGGRSARFSQGTLLPKGVERETPP